MLKTIFKTFGGTLLAAVIVLGLFAILSNVTYTADGKTYTGLIQIIGKTSTIENTSFKAEDTVFKDYASAPRPEVTFDNTGLGNIVKDEDYDILKYFKVKFNDQESLIDADTLEYTDFRIEDITRENGNSVLNLYDIPNKMINFNDPGVYTFTFYAIHNQKETVVKVKIPVN